MWDNSEKTILCYAIKGHWTWEEIYEALEDTRKLWNSVTHTVDQIVDMSQSAGFPRGNVLGHFRNITTYYHHDNTGNTAVIGADNYFRMASELFYKIYVHERQKPRSNTFYVKDMDDARAVLVEHRGKASTG
jgi:hypothetical protein